MKFLAQPVVLCLLFILTSAANPQYQSKPFELSSSLLGVVLWIVCLTIFVKQQPKVKYVQFQSFQVEEKGKGNGIHTEVNLDIHSHDDPVSHKTISEQNQQQTHHNTSFEKKKRKRKVDRIQALVKKESGEDMRQAAKPYHDSCVEVE